MSGAILRLGQVALLDHIDAAIADGCRRLIAQAPTGFGKTIVAARRLRRHQDAGRRAIFTVPALSLVDQTVEKLFAEGVTNVGVIQASHRMTNPARLIQIATPQSLQRREIPDADEILLDEVHIWFRKLYPKMLADHRFADVPIIGLTATPWTKGLGQHFERLIVGATTGQLIEEGHLSPFRSFAPASPDLTGVRTIAGDYREDDLAAAVNKTELVANVVETWQARAENRPTLCFAVDRAHAKNLQMQFQAAGISAEYIDCYSAAIDRNEIGKRFHAGDVKVVCNVGCLTTGIDWDVRCIILARPTKSEILYVQMIGRGLRTAEGKADCLILDHSDNHTRLGFVTDIHHDKLDDGEPKRAAIANKTEALPKKCIKCTFLKPSAFVAALVCDVSEFGVKCYPLLLCRRHRLSARGKLDQFTFTVHGSRLRDRNKTAAGTLQHFRWAAQQYKTKFGSFPPWAWNERPTCTPSVATLSWVRSRAIAFAKRRA